MNLHIFRTLRKINAHLKVRRKHRAGHIISPVRRIEFVAAPLARICAMTFDDGPTAAPCVPASGKGLTAHILDVLAAYGAKGTFNIIGSTAENYPDAPGTPGTHYVFGKKFDHYPYFGADALAGAANCPDLLMRMAREGHELANHGYRHILCGPEYFVYRKRAFFKSLDAVVADLARLHTLVREKTGQHMRLARPPHYVDKIGRFSRRTAYTAYAQMGYHYLAASIDGGGWMATCGDYAQDVQRMTHTLDAMLKKDPEGLRGQIIFQKDGYNMSMASPVADALVAQLKMLTDHGYTVVTVSDMLKISPFEDVPPDDPAHAAICALDAAGYCIGFRNNSFYPHDPITAQQLDAMCTPARNCAAAPRKNEPPLQAADIERIIHKHFAHSKPAGGVARRHAAMALHETLREVGALPPA